MSTVSVCMATHNGERFLRQQLDSILPQLRACDELIIADDHSTDGLPMILASYHDPRIRILPSKYFNNPARNFEYTLVHARNELIFLADQDDVWHLQKINIMCEKLQEVDLAICDCRLTDQELATVLPSFFKSNKSRPGLLKNLLRSSYMGCCMAFRREVLDKALPFPDAIQLHDQWIGLVAERHFRVAFIPQILVDHRRHHTNYSTTGAQSRNSLKKKLRLRFHLAKKLLLR
jgi:glycosyltransferase involved in cell wall biosynthesis